MATELWIIIAIVALFLIIVFSRLAVKWKQKSKQPKAEKPKKEKVVKEKKVKEKKEKTEKEPKPKKEKKEKYNDFIRPSDVAWAKLREKQRLEKERKEKEAQERASMPALAEGVSDNPNFVDESGKEVEEKVFEKPQGLTTEKTSELADEIKNLSPEMKALLFGDVLDKKTT